MTADFFSVATPEAAIYDGKHKLDTRVTDLPRGTLVELSATGEVIVDTGAGHVRGCAYEFMKDAEFPTTEDIADYMSGKYINFATGFYKAWLGPARFAGGALPALNALLYAGAAGNVGLFQTDVNQGVIGRVEAKTTIYDETGAAVEVALCQLNFTVQA